MIAVEVWRGGKLEAGTSVGGCQENDRGEFITGAGC